MTGARPFAYGCPNCEYTFIYRRRGRCPYCKVRLVHRGESYVDGEPAWVYDPRHRVWQKVASPNRTNTGLM